MALKGTSRRSQHILYLGVENLAAHLNACTSQFLRQEFPQRRSDIFPNSKFECAAVELERAVIQLPTSHRVILGLNPHYVHRTG